MIHAGDRSSRRTPVYVLARGPEGAKSRLAAALEPRLRSDLAVAMLGDVLVAADQVAHGRVVVVTESAAMRDVAIAAGAEILDTPPSGTNAAAVIAFAAAAASGSQSALVIASDLPLLSPDDLEALLDASDGADVVIAPDRHGRGTNALLLAPPSAIAPAFGDDSFARHQRRALSAGARVRIVTTPGLATDLDDAADLREVMASPARGRGTRDVLSMLALP